MATWFEAHGVPRRSPGQKTEVPAPSVLCPLRPDKRTSSDRPGMSEKCQTCDIGSTHIRGEDVPVEVPSRHHGGRLVANPRDNRSASPVSGQLAQEGVSLPNIGRVTAAVYPAQRLGDAMVS
jgi:hypothetical protein